MVPNHENMEGDQPVQSHSHTQQPLQPQTCVQELPKFVRFAGHFEMYTGWPKKNGTVDFSGLCSDQQLSFSPCWIEHLFLIIITPRSSNLVENFILWVISYGRTIFLCSCHFRDLPDFQSSEAQLMTASAVHKLSEYCVQWSVYCLVRIYKYNPNTSLALRFLCSWLNACVGACTCCWSCH